MGLFAGRLPGNAVLAACRQDLTGAPAASKGQRISALARSVSAGPTLRRRLCASQDTENVCPESVKDELEINKTRDTVDGSVVLPYDSLGFTSPPQQRKARLPNTVDPKFTNVVRTNALPKHAYSIATAVTTTSSLRGTGAKWATIKRICSGSGEKRPRDTYELGQVCWCHNKENISAATSQGWQCICDKLPADAALTSTMTKRSRTSFFHRRPLSDVTEQIVQTANNSVFATPVVSSLQWKGSTPSLQKLSSQTAPTQKQHRLPFQFNTAAMGLTKTVMDAAAKTVSSSNLDTYFSQNFDFAAFERARNNKAAALSAKRPIVNMTAMDFPESSRVLQPRTSTSSHINQDGRNLESKAVAGLLLTTAKEPMPNETRPRKIQLAPMSSAENAKENVVVPLGSKSNAADIKNAPSRSLRNVLLSGKDWITGKKIGKNSRSSKENEPQIKTAHEQMRSTKESLAEDKGLPKPLQERHTKSNLFVAPSMPLTSMMKAKLSYKSNQKPLLPTFSDTKSEQDVPIPMRTRASTFSDFARPSISSLWR